MEVSTHGRLPKLAMDLRVFSALMNLVVCYLAAWLGPFAVLFGILACGECDHSTQAFVDGFYWVSAVITVILTLTTGWLSFSLRRGVVPMGLVPTGHILSILILTLALVEAAHCALSKDVRELHVAAMFAFPYLIPAWIMLLGASVCRRGGVPLKEGIELGNALLAPRSLAGYVVCCPEWLGYPISEAKDDVLQCVYWKLILVPGPGLSCS